MRSFKDARLAFKTNLALITNELGYTPTTLAMKLSGLSSSGKTVATGQNVSDWLNGNSIPNMYQFYKLCQFLNIPLDYIMDSKFKIETFVGCSFAKAGRSLDQKSNGLDEFAKVCNQLLNTTFTINTTSTSTRNTNMASTTITISKNQNMKMQSIVKDRTDSKNANRVLASKLYGGDDRLMDIAAAVGCSTRSLRDYAFYGTTVPADTVENLRQYFNTTAHNLGLYLNKDTGRYEHLSVTVRS